MQQRFPVCSETSSRALRKMKRNSSRLVWLITIKEGFKWTNSIYQQTNGVSSLDKTKGYEKLFSKKIASDWANLIEAQQIFKNFRKEPRKSMRDLSQHTTFNHS